MVFTSNSIDVSGLFVKTSGILMDYITDAQIKEIVDRVAKSLQSDAATIAANSLTHSHPLQPGKNVAIGSDHGGFCLKEKLKAYLVELGYTVIDCGTHSEDSVDYPDYALKVAEKVATQSAWRGIMIDGAGIGSCMVANKVAGVRAAMCYDYATAVNSREHNDANLLTLGAGLIGLNQAKLIVKTWLETDFGGGRHAPRVAKIMAIEKQSAK